MIVLWMGLQIFVKEIKENLNVEDLTKKYEKKKI
jgi:hypothetical protein